MTLNSEQYYMKRALELAQLGRGNVSPNPMVGCVIVYNDKIVGEGWHKKYGQAHAEVNAVNDVVSKFPNDHDAILSQSTAYVTLEPCSHFGKTPPCADLLISKKIKKVVVCNHDPNPLVAGKGILKLKNAGIEVVEGILENEGSHINKRFFNFIFNKRPYIILKWAQTADGFLANEDGSPIKISNQLSQIYSHKMRAEEDAIMVGTNTALNDNPQLNVRQWRGRNPIRIVLDKSLRLPQQLKIFDDSQPTICYHQSDFEVNANFKSSEFVQLNFDSKLLESILNDLYNRKIQSLIVEGGAKLLQTFLNLGLFDEIRIFKSKNKHFKGIKAPTPPVALNVLETKDLMGDLLEIYQA